MRRRSLSFLLSLLSTSVSLANDASWDCKQDTVTHAWLCAGDQKPVDNSDVLIPSEQKSSTNDEQPEVSVPPRTPKKTQAAPAQHLESDSLTPKSLQSLQPTPSVSSPTVESVAPKAVENSQPTTPAPAEIVTQQPVVNKAAPAETVIANTPSPDVCGDKNGQCPNAGANPIDQDIDADKSAMRLITPAFDHQQEQAFKSLTAQIKYDPWQQCNKQRGTQQGYVPGASLRNTSPLDVKSNYAEVFDNEIGSYTGNVIMNRADQHSVSNTADYDKVSQTLDLHGDVYYNEDELALHSQTATLNLATDQAKLRDSLFISPGAPLRGSSQVIYRDSKTFSRYKTVAVTSCRPGNQDWVLHASELKMNTEEGKASANNAWMEFKGVPILYLPYVSFPTDNRRLSGFLAPSYSITQRSGLQLSAPYYWNIAPNYDATFRPRYFSKRGAILGTNFRYLTEKTKGYIDVEYMPHDSQANQSRYLGAVKNNTVFTPHITSNVDLNLVSDKNYFTDLGNALSIPNFNYLRSAADVNYRREGVAFSVAALSYQSVNPLLTPVQLPYQKLPQVTLNLNHSFRPYEFLPIDALVESETVNFTQQVLPDGQRYNIKPSVALPLQTTAGFIKPKVSFQYTQYVLNQQSPGLATNISRALPILSLDTGMFFERDLNVGDTPMQHTLEPRLFYLYIPRKDQSAIPLFDTAQYDFVYNSLFRENRFSGTDRIQDANQVSTAITSRLIDNTTGRERLKFNLGAIFYFQNRDVTLNGPVIFQSLYPPSWYPVETNSTSPLVAELTSEVTKNLSLDTMMQWDPHSNSIVRGKGFVHYNAGNNKIINAGYFYRKNPLVPDRSNDIIYSDVSAHWPIYDNWSAVGRWQYSLLYDRTQEGFFGVEKENCCWRFRIIGRHYINSVVNINGVNSLSTQSLAQGQTQNGVFFEFEFKGLGVFDSGPEMGQFLERNIYGYRKNITQ